MTKINHFFLHPNNVPVQVWSKSTQWFRRYRHEATRTPTPSFGEHNERPVSGAGFGV